MMTSFAFILGLYPLVVASGASQLARRDVGTPVFGGMILASFIGIFAIPPARNEAGAVAAIASHQLEGLRETTAAKVPLPLSQSYQVWRTWP